MRNRESLKIYTTEFPDPPGDAGDPFIAIGRLQDLAPQLLSQLAQAKQCGDTYLSARVGVAKRPDGTIVWVYNLQLVADLHLETLAPAERAEVELGDWGEFEQSVEWLFDQGAVTDPILLTDFQCELLSQDGAIG
jgi:hypothetical protein